MGEVKDLDDETANNVWKYICPTMVDRCENLGDCKKEGQDENSFCCTNTIKFPADFKDTIKTCVPKYKEVPKGAAKNDANDLQKTPIGEFDKLIEY